MCTWRLSWVCGLLLAGCSRHFLLPMSAADVIGKYRSVPEALVVYLGQPAADLDICNLRSEGPHFALNAETSELIVAGLEAGKIAPAIWRECVELLTKSAPPESFALLLNEMGQAYRDLIKNSSIENNVTLRQRLYELHRMYLLRPAGLSSTSQQTDPLFEELRIALREEKLGPQAAGFGEELIVAFDLEHDRWQGQPVSLETIDTLFDAADEPTLWKFQARLHTDDLRDQARRRIIRLHIAASTYPEVKSGRLLLEELLMSGARNVVDAKSTILGGAVRDVPWETVLVRERLDVQEADLYGVDARNAKLYSRLELRSVVQARVKHISQPITVCAPAEHLDPSPCLLPTEVSVDSPFARVDASGVGVLQLGSKLSMKDVFPLAKSGGALEIPVRVGGMVVSKFKLGLRFERPADLVLSGNYGGGDGPDLRVAIDCPGPNVVSFVVNDVSYTRTAYVEASDTDEFQIQSQGGVGYQGTPGYSGYAGASGAECQNGTSGGNGGDGGSGGPGGNGGNVTIRILCSTGLSEGVGFSMLQKILRRTITSVGGAGGLGGIGGSGGPGGAGGPGRSATTHSDSEGRTVTDDEGCSAGYSGSSGISGSNGYPGTDGQAGLVSFAN